MNDKKSEIYRCRELMALGEARGMTKEATKAIADETSIEAFRSFLLNKLPLATPVGIDPIPDQNLGLSQKEVEGFSFRNIINHMSQPNRPDFHKAAGFELEVSEAFSKKIKRTPRGCFVPPEVLNRDLTVGVDADGGYLVGTDIRPQNFIETLRNRTVCLAAGATVISDLTGDIAIPKQSGESAAYWVAENGEPTESQPAFGQAHLSPHTLGAIVELTRKLLIQSSVDVESYIRNDLARVLAIEIDRACLHGTGSDNQPTGIAATSGIGSVAGGTNGAAPTFQDIIDLESEVAQDNADVGHLAYISNVKVRGKLKNTLITETYGEKMVWNSDAGNKPLNGHPAHITNSVSSSLTKGTASEICSAIFFGNWADLIIAFWSGLDLLVDPYTGSSSGKVKVTAFQDLDVGVRHAESFSAMLDALTT